MKWKSSPGIFLVTDWIIFYDKKITKNSIIVLLCEDGPHFYVVCNFIIIENSFQIVAHHMHDWNFNEHFQAFKICDLKNFSWKVISEKDVTEAELTIARQL